METTYPTQRSRRNSLTPRPVSASATRGGRSSSMSYVTDGREAIGFVLARGRAGYEALGREQHSLGLFKTAAAAANVVFNAAASERP
jgi:hypothetical protein